jgi:hypothetical protein
MAVYQLIDQMSRDPESRDKWIIERAIPGAPPIRLLFQGTKRAAVAEVTRLNTFLKSKTGGAGSRAAEPRPLQPRVDAMTISTWGTHGFGMGDSPD